MMPTRVATALTALGAGVWMVACSAFGGASKDPTLRPTPKVTVTSAASSVSGLPSPSPSASVHGVVGTVVRFSAGSTVVQVTIEDDTATARDFLSRLPMRLRFEDFDGREKVARPDRPFDYHGAPGMTPRDGDLFSYRPWGNLGFFYDATGLGHSDDLVRIGTTDDLEQVRQLDGKQVTIRIVG